MRELPAQELVNGKSERGVKGGKEMAGPTGYYYLHTETKDLIYKRADFPPDESSPFVEKVWPIYPSDRGSAWVIVTEALALGADKSRINELAEKWGLTDSDAEVFAGRAKLKLFRDGDQWCATFYDFTNLQESQAGFGDTALEALAMLAVE